MNSSGAPSPSLRRFDVFAIVVGLVIGAGIFKAPAVVAANVGSGQMLMAAWALGGLVSIAGALCYAELATSYPHAGGEYHFLRRAFGTRLSFLFAWSRLVVLQTGSIALLAFVFGDYAARLMPLGDAASAVYAGTAILALTLLNIAGLVSTTRVQSTLMVITLGGVAAIIVVGLLSGGVPAAPDTAGRAEGSFGLAMVFVLLTYGGWNEVAYVSAELRGGRNNMAKVLVTGLGLIVAVYLLVNLAYLQVLGLDGMRSSDVVTADMAQALVGEWGAVAVSVLIAVTVLASINVTILTGARTNYALGADFPLFGSLGHWHAGSNAPVTALVVQGAIALMLVLAGTFTRSGFETMVEYVAPVFWFFFLLTALSLFVLRRRDPARDRPFRVPGYPAVPLVFVGACGYMLYSSLAYTGFGALAGVLFLIAGLPLMRRASPRPR